MTTCRRCFHLHTLAAIFAFATPAFAAETVTSELPVTYVGPENVLLVANSAFEGSVDLARYYAEKHGIPEENLLFLELPVTEDIDRDCFNMKVQAPVKAKVDQLLPRVRCIVTFYGVPLNIWDPQPEQAEISRLKRDLEGIKLGTFQNDKAALETRIAALEKAVKELVPRAASVDSELALLGRDHPLEGHVDSPFVKEKWWPEGCFWVARLDAGTPADVRAMIDRALDAEKDGLKGTAYFDARGLTGADDYAKADGDIRQAAELARGFGFPTVLDDKPELFGENKCPLGAIYWGWYSLAKYVDSFQFVPGAIAVHVASGECNSLREGPYWCRNLIRNGAAVTMGPTNEPYLEAFPSPTAFLGKLFEGECIGQAYYETQGWLSWRMVLLGDPLYRPFRKNALAAVEARHDR